MGLSGRKQKQRIANDPRNLAWSDDAARFGQAYLSKLGWDSTKGLGVGGEGRLSHVKVSQKLDMLGIGAAQQRDPNGIAWKQNKDFEALLERLNGGTAAPGGKVPMAGFDAAREVEAEIEVEVGQKRKREEDHSVATDESEEDGKKRKREKKEKKEKKRQAKEAAAVDDSQRKSSNKSSAEETAPAEDADSAVVPAPYVPRVKAHRRRVLASKDIASKSASSIAEILGVSRTSSSSATPVPLSAVDSHMGTLTTISDELTKISTTSVEDYFKARLLAKSKLSTSTAVATSSEAPSTESPADPYSEMEFAPRRGIGATSAFTSMTPAEPDAEANRIGLSAFSMLRTSAFLNASTSFQLPSVSEQALDSPSLPTGEEEAAPAANVSNDDSGSKKRKRSQGELESVEVIEEVKKSKKNKKEKKEEREKKCRSIDADGVLSSETKEERKARRKAEKVLAKASSPPLAERTAGDSVDPTTPDPSLSLPEEKTLTKEQRKAARAERKSEKERKRQLKAASQQDTS